MSNRDTFVPFNQKNYHKGFYNDDIVRSLCGIEYESFWELPDDEFPIVSAYCLLYGVCNIFVLALREEFGYDPYIIEETKGKGFHAFCQIYKARTCYYVDARGITTSFDEFYNVAKSFVNGEFIIRPVTAEDEDDWKKDDYFENGFAFAKAVIEKYSNCYTVD